MTDPEYTLMSKRLGFRMLDDHDLQNLMRLDMNLEVRAFFPEGVSTPMQLRAKIIKSRTSFLQKGLGEFSITDLKTNEFLGRAGFAELSNGEIEVGYLLLKEYWGKGIATEALSTLLDWAGKALSVPRILAYAPINHHASIGVMKKVGMRYLKTEPSHGVKCIFYEYPLKRHDTPAKS